MTHLNNEENLKRMTLWKHGLNDIEIAKACGVTSPTICRWRTINGLENNYKVKKLSDEEKERILKLYNEGYKGSEIATLVGVSTATVYQYMKKNMYNVSESNKEKIDELNIKEKLLLEYLREKYPNARESHLFSLAKFAIPQIDLYPTSLQKRFVKKIRVSGYKTVYYFDDDEYSFKEEAVKLFLDANNNIFDAPPHKLRHKLSTSVSKEIYDLIYYELKKIKHKCVKRDL